MKICSTYRVNYNLLETQQLRLKAKKQGRYEDYFGIPCIQPCFRRDFVIYGLGEWQDTFCLSELKNLSQRGPFLFTKQGAGFDQSFFEFEAIAGESTQMFLVFKKRQLLRTFNYGYYPGPTSRFNSTNLKENQVYVTGTGNPEIESFISHMLFGCRTLELSEIEKQEPVIYGSYNRDSILNPEFKKFYQEQLIEGKDFIGEKKLKRFELSVEFIEHTILNDNWCDRNGVTSKILVDFHGGILVLERGDKKRLKENLDLITSGPFKQIKTLIVKNYPYPGWDYLPLVILAGVVHED